MRLGRLSILSLVLAIGLCVAAQAVNVQMVDVDSTLIQQVGYDAASRTLVIKFVTDGSVYEYYDVPQEVYEALMAAESKGRYFTRHIKNKYRFERKS